MNNQHLITNYYITHRDELLAFVSSRLGGRAEAEDVVQNVFLRLLTNTKLITETTLPALVYTTARHMIFDIHRHRANVNDYEHYIRKVCSDELSQMKPSIIMTPLKTCCWVIWLVAPVISSMRCSTCCMTFISRRVIAVERQ